MKYALLIHVAPGSHESLTEAEQRSVSAEYWALGEDASCLSGAHLAPPDTTTTVRVSDGEQLVTDGPFADTKEVFGGFYLIDVGDLDDATAFAARIPAARLGGAIEIRPLMGDPDPSELDGAAAAGPGAAA